MFENLLDSPILYSLALTLIHFLWQGCLIAVVLKCVLSSISYKNPQLRYLWSTIALLTCLIVPIVTFTVVYTPSYLNNELQRLSSIIPFDVTQSISVINATWYQVTIDSLPFLSLTWILMVILLSAKLLFALKQVNHLVTSDTIPANNVLQTNFSQQVRKFKFWRKPQLLISLSIEVPMAIGWLKPVILLPAVMASGLTAAQLEMLILHELAHIRRHDYLVNFLQTLVEILLFFHPGVRWISKQMRNEREYCSDDIAVKHCGNAIAYAHTLADTASLCHRHRHNSIPTMAMAASGGDLKQRVVRLIDQEHNCTANEDSGKMLASMVILFAILSVFSKPFIDSSIIDWGAGRISLIQSASQLIRHQESYDQPPLSQTSLAQQLVQQTSNNQIADATNEDIFSQSQIETANTNIKTVHLTKLDKSSLNSEPLIEEQLTQSNTRLSKKIPHVNTEIKHKQSDDGIGAVKPTIITQEKKSFSDFAFERTDTATSKSNFENPYASQVASLVDEPLPSNVSTIEFESAYKEIIDTAISTPESSIQAVKNENNRPIISNISTAKLISSVEPKYPSVAKRKGIEMDILVKFMINTDGLVTDLEFEEKSKVSYFRNTIRTAMNKWRFQPVKINERPVESQMAKIFSFSLIK